jgi:hypothetical protein
VEHDLLEQLEGEFLGTKIIFGNVTAGKIGIWWLCYLGILILQVPLPLVLDMTLRQSLGVSVFTSSKDSPW